jgi:hypothetical protein
MSRNLIITLAIIFVVGLIGWGVYNPEPDIAQDRQVVDGGIGGGPGEVLQSPQQISPQTDLQRLFVNHGTSASEYLQAYYDGTNITEKEALLNENTEQLAAAVEQLGGSREAFLVSWQGHIDEYKNYTTALKNNDREGTAQARGTLNTHAEDMGRMISALAPAVSAEMAARLMNEHIDLTLSIIEAHARGDEAEKMAQSTRASVQAIRFANIVEDGLEEAMVEEPAPGSGII